MRSNYLKLYIGPMFSGKTTNLLKEIDQYMDIYNFLVVNNILDKERHTSTRNFSHIKTHDNKSFPATMVSNLMDLRNKHSYIDADVVIIDEAQFFKDLYDFLFIELNDCSKKKMFIVAGLSSDYNMNPIGDIIRLIPLCDEVYKLKSICNVCKEPASFTKKNLKENQDNQILIGNSDIYSPVCRLHHT